MHGSITVNIRSPMQFQLIRHGRERFYLQLCWYRACQNVTIKTLNPKVQGSTP